MLSFVDTVYFRQAYIEYQPMADMTFEAIILRLDARHGEATQQTYCCYHLQSVYTLYKP